MRGNTHFYLFFAKPVFSFSVWEESLDKTEWFYYNIKRINISQRVRICAFAL